MSFEVSRLLESDLERQAGTIGSLIEVALAALATLAELSEQDPPITPT